MFNFVSRLVQVTLRLGHDRGIWESRTDSRRAKKDNLLQTEA